MRPAAAAFVAAAAALLSSPVRAEGPSDWFDPFRGRDAYVVDDSAWVAREMGASEESEPLFRVRHLLLVFRTDDGEVRFWERRNLLLVRTERGRWAAEIAVRATRDDEVVDGPTPWARLATDGRVLETWADDAGDETEDPCTGLRHLVRGGGREAVFHAADRGTRTVREALRELRERVFTPAQVADLRLLERLAPEQPGFEVLLAQPRAAWGDMADGVEERDVFLFPDPAPPEGDVQEWGTLTWLPGSLSPMGLPEGL